MMMYGRIHGRIVPSVVTMYLLRLMIDLLMRRRNGTIRIRYDSRGSARGSVITMCLLRRIIDLLMRWRN